jgi:acetyl esterase
MNLDPDLLHLLQSLPSEVPVPVDWVAAREGSKAILPLLAGPHGPVPVATIEERRIEGHAEVPPVRLYRPAGSPAMTLIHFHGGGWALGDLDTCDHTVRQLCHRLDALVVSCTYRLAPEHPFPAAYDDAVAIARWVLTHIEELGGDAQRVMIVGDSAGGNLAAAVTLALRDEARLAIKAQVRLLPQLRAQLLLYPGVDVRDSARLTASYLADRDPSLRTAMVAECIAAYVAPEQRGDWRASPLAAGDLSGLPPAMVVVLSVDPLRDQGVSYAARLQEAGVACELIEFPHLTHGFFHIGALVPAAAKAFDDVLARFARFVDPAGGGEG